MKGVFELRKILLFFMGVTMLLLAACSQSFEDKIVGHWERVDKEEACDSNLEEGFNFKEDGFVEGIESYKTYEIDQKKENHADIILDGKVAESTRYSTEIDENNILSIKEKDAKRLTCKMEKVEE